MYLNKAFKKGINYLVLFSVIFNLNVQAQEHFCVHHDKKGWPRDRQVDFTHLKAEISFVENEGLVKGKVTHSFTPLRNGIDSLYIDGPGVRIKSAKLNDKTVKYGTDKNGIYFLFDRKLTFKASYLLELEYEANPRKGMYFIGWNDPQNMARKQIWTQGQGIDNRYWLPCFDSQNDKITTEIIVRFNSKYKVLSNGELKSKKADKSGNTTWHYIMQKPHSPYLIMLGIGEYEVEQRKSKSGIPLNLYYYPDHKERVEHTYEQSVEMFDYFEKIIGFPYPWKSYSQIPVQDFLYGAMENTTATIFGDFFCVDERAFYDGNYVKINAHELAHQWFGDFVTSRSTEGHWLHESFATHFHNTYEGVYFGKDHFDWVMRDNQNAALQASKSNDLPITHSGAGSTRHYQKGSFVLNMMRYIVGDEDFFRAIASYLKQYPYGLVDSKDLLHAFQDELGHSLNWFWEQWVYKGGEPHYEVSFSEVKESEKSFSQFVVNQVQEQNTTVGLFKMPIVFEVHYTDGSKTSEKIWIENNNHIVRIANPDNKKIAYALFDPDNRILKKCDFNKPLEQLKHQAEKAEFMIDRYDALVQLRNYKEPDKSELLQKLYKKESFYIVKAEIVAQVLQSMDYTNFSLVKKAITDSDVQLRKEVLIKTSFIHPALQGDYELLLSDASYETIQIALIKLCNQFPDKTDYYLELTKNEKGIKGHNIRISWLSIAYQKTKKQEYIDELIGYVSQSYDFLTRISAATELQKINYVNNNLIDNLFNAVCNANGKLSSSCGKVLKHFMSQSMVAPQIIAYYQSKNFKDYEREAIVKYLE